MAGYSRSDVVEEIVILQGSSVIFRERLTVTFHNLADLVLFFSCSQDHACTHTRSNCIFTLGATEDEHNRWQHVVLFKKFNDLGTSWGCEATDLLLMPSTSLRPWAAAR